MGNQCGCWNHEDHNSDFIIKKNATSPVNIATSKQIKSNQSLVSIKTKSRFMKEIDSMEPIHHSDFEICNLEKSTSKDTFSRNNNKERNKSSNFSDNTPYDINNQNDIEISSTPDKSQYQKFNDNNNINQYQINMNIDMNVSNPYIDSVDTNENNNSIGNNNITNFQQNYTSNFSTDFQNFKKPQLEIINEMRSEYSYDSTAYNKRPLSKQDNEYLLNTSKNKFFHSGNNIELNKIEEIGNQ